MYKLCVIVTLYIFSSACLGARGEWDGNSFVDLQERAQHILLVRVESAKWGNVRNDCRYQYAFDIIHSYKGGIQEKVCYSSPLVAGNRYLVIGNIEINGEGQAVLGFWGLPAAYPLLPYGFDVPDNEAWMAVGSAEYKFPKEVRQTVDGAWKACHIPVNVGWSDPCLMPPPLVRFADVDQLLKRLNSTEK